MKNVLIAEDDADIRAALKDLLTGEGYAVTAVADGERALSAWKGAEVPFDLLLLDVMMPGRSGYDVCREVRASGSRVDVLMLSAKGEEIDKVVGLELGADDYVTKPFGVRELLARIAAAIRRSEPAVVDAGGTLPFAGATVSTRDYRLKGPGGDEQLTEMEMKLVRLFASHRNAVLTRNALLNDVWGVEYMGTTRTLDQHIANLRRKVAAAGGDPAALMTVHGTGYRYV